MPLTPCMPCASAQVCHAIGSLVFNHPANQQAAAGLGAPGPLVQILRHAPACPSAAGEAARALGNLSFNNGPMKEQMRTLGCVEALVNALKVRIC